MLARQRLILCPQANLTKPASSRQCGRVAGTVTAIAGRANDVPQAGESLSQAAGQSEEGMLLWRKGHKAWESL